MLLTQVNLKIFVVTAKRLSNALLRGQHEQGAKTRNQYAARRCLMITRLTLNSLWDVSHDPAEHPRRYLPRKRLLRPRFNFHKIKSRVRISLRISNFGLLPFHTFCGGYLLVLATVLRCRRYTFSFDAKSRIYILLLNIFSPRVPRVTLVPCPNTTQSAKRSEA